MLSIEAAIINIDATYNTPPYIVKSIGVKIANIVKEITTTAVKKTAIIIIPDGYTIHVIERTIDIAAVNIPSKM